MSQHAVRPIFYVLLCSSMMSVACSPSASDLSPHQPLRLLGAERIGPVPADQVIDLVLIVKRRAPDRLARLLVDQARGAAPALSPLEFADRFGASVEDYAQLVSWVQLHALEVVRLSTSRSGLTIRGKASAIEAALGTRLDRYRDDSGEFRAPSAALDLGAIGGIVTTVVGLDDAGAWYSHRTGAPTPVPAATNGSQDPVDLQGLYGTAAIPQAGEGETVAILGTGTPPNPEIDLDGYITKFSLPIQRFQQYTQVLLGGANRDPEGLANSEYVENLLDIDMVWALAPHANVVHVLTATNAPGLFGDGILFIVDQVPQAHAVSVSFGTCERVAASEILSINLVLEQAKAEGQQWFFASGDSGTDGCRDGRGNKVLSIDWPASSPFAIAVGGTQLSSMTESAWTGSGGGQSEIVVKPAFQTGVGPYPNDGVRDIPDVAALAGPPGLSTFAQGIVFASQGTSAATPMWAAMWALIDQKKQAGLGIFDGAERLYQVGMTQPNAFHDITSGTNGNGSTPGYPALVGYDLATGWGSPNLPNLIAAW